MIASPVAGATAVRRRMGLGGGRVCGGALAVNSLQSVADYSSLL